jgi:hypothetical protein
MFCREHQPLDVAHLICLPLLFGALPRCPYKSMRAAGADGNYCQLQQFIPPADLEMPIGGRQNDPASGRAL